MKEIESSELISPLLKQIEKECDVLKSLYRREISPTIKVIIIIE